MSNQVSEIGDWDERIERSIFTLEGLIPDLRCFDPRRSTTDHWILNLPRVPP